MEYSINLTENDWKKGNIYILKSIVRTSVYDRKIMYFNAFIGVVLCIGFFLFYNKEKVLDAYSIFLTLLFTLIIFIDILFLFYYFWMRKADKGQLTNSFTASFKSSGISINGDCFNCKFGWPAVKEVIITADMIIVCFFMKFVVILPKEQISDFGDFQKYIVNYIDNEKIR